MKASAWVYSFCFLSSLPSIFFGFPGPFTPFRGLGLLSFGFQSGLTDFRASAWVLGFRAFSSYEGNTTGN